MNDTGGLDAGVAIAPQLYQLLRGRIVRTELLPGEVISETEIARAYQVSRQPVREAFIKLSEAGLVQIRPQRGTMITRISHQAVMDARFVREAIEADVVRMVAENCDGPIRAELQDQIAAQKRMDDYDNDTFVRLDELFHRTLAEMAGNPYAWRVVEDVKAQMDRVRYLSVQKDHIRTLIIQHARIVDAICTNDVTGAEAAMRAHLREILKSLPEVEKARPELFNTAR
ncbi:DNA-binding transcriptional regulator, GntR family [Paracoccus alcaliphilus]|uniref:DNA-binding transcriptional regulator, GntR family n=1 Tax=Paracoccus alcaliphilus TaxID=34002 RepID=A0A1H8EYD9_9RHOB|nr:GntR family transcriptional regulator [Paracoccus alcaliphilus]WCR20097.1 GntR family transcriptional regulator [Paracoccus alcaliphilus]SEN24469.1 DNA-binding transcriptional regulator, GntR family [Paracoccus alcaliphilus]